MNTVVYKVWSVLQEQVYKMKVNNVDYLRQRIQTVDELDQVCLSNIMHSSIGYKVICRVRCPMSNVRCPMSDTLFCMRVRPLTVGIFNRI